MRSGLSCRYHRVKAPRWRQPAGGGAFSDHSSDYPVPGRWEAEHQQPGHRSFLVPPRASFAHRQTGEERELLGLGCSPSFAAFCLNSKGENSALNQAKEEDPKHLG